jgi:hypothetical protein
MRQLFSLAPAVNVAPESFKIEEEIQLRTELLKQQQQQSAAATATVSGSTEDMILLWSSRRGAKGNLAGFETVFNIYDTALGAACHPSEMAPAALAKFSVIDVCSLQSPAHMVAALREIFSESDAPPSSAGSGGGGIHNGSVSASLYTTANSGTMQQDFLVDPALSADPAAWPGLLWNATDYLKVLRHDGIIASDNNSLCIHSTHFFA